MNNLSWNEIYRIVHALTAMPELNRKGCEATLGCEFWLVDKTPLRTWYAGICPEAPIAEIDLRIGKNGGILVLELDPAYDRKTMFEGVVQLGQPLDFSFPTDNNLSHETSWIYEINGRRVAFTKKAVEGVDYLISVAIHC